MEVTTNYAGFTSFLTTTSANLYSVVDVNGNLHLCATSSNGAFTVYCVLYSGDPNIANFNSTYAAYSNLAPNIISSVRPGHASLGTPTVNPANLTVLATTGVLTTVVNTNYLLEAFVSSSAAAIFSLQTMSGASVVANIYMMVPASGSISYTSKIPFWIPSGLEIRLVNIGAITGTVQGNILWTAV